MRNLFYVAGLLSFIYYGVIALSHAVDKVSQDNVRSSSNVRPNGQIKS